jgi:threonine/homoserine/homoserine lactone efflux protein
MIMGGIFLLYVGLNAWRLYRHVEKEKQIQTELDSYRVKEAELRAFWEAYW